MAQTDFYLEQENVIERLIKEWNTYGNLIIAYDFDNTVYDFHNEGHSYEQVINLIRECKKIGAYLIVFTASEEERHPFIKEYLDSNDIPFDSINKNMPNSPFKGGKVYYNILLDDRAGLKSAYESLSIALKIMKKNMEEK